LELFAKGSYFLSSEGIGSHDMVFGYDNFDDRHFSNNHQSGSDWIINGTTSIVQGTKIYPQFLGDGSTFINYRPILQSSKGTHFRTYAGFYNDRWRLNSHTTLNLGVRWDRNHGVDSGGQLVTKDHGVSPRLGIVWDPNGEGAWSVTGSFAKYVAGIANSGNVADAGTGAGRPALFQYVYRGPSINPPGTDSPVTSDIALQQLFSWFNANGGQNLPLSSVSYPGVSTKILGSLASPNVLEYAGGVNRQLGKRGALRVDAVYRDYQDFYSQRTDLSTGKVSSPAGQTFDLTVVENTNAVKRKYAGLTTQLTYRVSSGLDTGGNYTLSHAHGNIEGETVGAGPVTATVLRYTEYKDPKWNSPEGDLSVDQRHHVRLWATYELPSVSGLGLAVLEDLGSGAPYGGLGSIDARPYVANPGYITPQGGNTVDYFFTARDAFHTKGYNRTDLALNYKYALAGLRRVEFFGQAQVVNLFNQFQLCGCGASVFANGGNITQTNIDQSILTNSNAARYQAFNPFTTTPVQGVNWDYGPNFGKALNRFAYSSPRTFHVSFGVRF
jgi:TonB dependent receptor